jgi:hypothetical protein
VQAETSTHMHELTFSNGENEFLRCFSQILENIPKLVETDNQRLPAKALY